MKIGISALLFNLDEALNICERIKDIKHIEVGIDNIEECKDLMKYKSKFKDLNLSVGIHLPMELNTCENIKFIRESWKSFILEIKQELNLLEISYFNLHLGYAMSNRLKKNREKYLEISSKFLSEITGIIKENIFIENVYSKQGDFSNIGNMDYDFEYIFNKIKNERLGFCYDTGHNLINSGEYLRKLKDKIRLVHLSDNDGIDDIHIGIGKGILSIEDIRKVVKDKPEFLVLEIGYEYIEESIKILETIVKEA
ncbi:sugar phosphate isomerase/epimerase family protein [Romboutsia lituseburensis]|uniref:sugar phosphate isomerase/epimerase family protein n=1 Tax=Romboutsia lituseburensis TaxID=1537 RepID=UPI00215A483A|nr:sugar phosphate isomerase/epimerase [Romboutsia lituseburensis]MCR8745613.1 sugar phosphate isomerase/epimerase [Romboutsia lituseburensis]